jgi:hypothetical protein
MIHHHLLQLISTSASVGYYEADPSHSATRGATVVLYPLELSRNVSRTELRISYRDVRVGTDWALNAIANGEGNQYLGMRFQSALRR